MLAQADKKGRTKYVGSLVRKHGITYKEVLITPSLYHSGEVIVYIKLTGGLCDNEIKKISKDFLFLQLATSLRRAYYFSRTKTGMSFLFHHCLNPWQLKHAKVPD